MKKYFFPIFFIVISITLASFGVDYLIFGKYKYLDSAGIINPEQYSQHLFDDGRFKDLQEYIDFYRSIPGLKVTEQMDTLYEEASNKRNSVSYITSEMLNSLFLGKSQETYGKIAEISTEMFLFGDVRDLITTGYKLYDRKELDDYETFTAAISAIGVSVALLSVGPHVATGVMAKTGLSIIKIAHRTKNLSLSFSKQLIQIAGNSKAIGDLIEPLKMLRNFTKTYGLDATLHVIRHVDSLASLSKVFQNAVNLGDDMFGMIKFGGKGVLASTSTFGKATVKPLIVYGEDVVQLLNKMPADRLLRDARKYTAMLNDGILMMVRACLKILECLGSLLSGIFTLIGIIFRVKATSSMINR